MVIREIEILKQVRGNPYFTELIEVIKPKQLDSIFIVQKLHAPDQDLRTLLLSNKRQSEMNLKKLVYNLLRAVDSLHEANIMHRDLKPANLLVDENQGLKICDFGLSRNQI